MAIFEKFTEIECINKRHPLVKGDNFDQYCAITENRCKLLLLVVIGHRL